MFASRRPVRAVLVTTAVFTALVALAAVMAGSAAAATDTFGCRASAARVDLGSTPIEPLVANSAGSPCVTKTAGLASVGIPTSATPVLNVGPASVDTFTTASEPTTLGPNPPGVAATTTVDAVSIPSAKLSIVGPITDEVTYSCVNGAVASSATSNLGVIEINGQTINLGTPGTTLTIPLGALGSITLNEKIVTATSLTERLVDVHLNGIGDVIVGEASVTQSGDPCNGSGTGPTGSTGTTGTTGTGGTVTPPSTTTPSGLTPCPAGTTLDLKTQLCVIVIDGQPVIVSAPFAGPKGGTVMSVQAAKKLYKSACLGGPGPLYVIVGTQRADRIIGTHRPERFLGLGGNDRIAGQGGNDCVDGAAGNDTVFGGQGHYRVYGGPGNDRLSVQAGSSHVSGDAGNDTIFLGNGNDVVYGGSGNDRIGVGRGNSHLYGGAGNDTLAAHDGNTVMVGGAGNDRFYAGNGNDRLYGGPGNDRLFGRAVKLDAYCGAGSDRAFVTTIDVPFAKAHGCEKVTGLKLRR